MSVYDPLDDVLPDLQGLEDAEIKHMLERASAVDQLTQHPSWGMYVDYLVALSGASQEYILTGRCKTIEDYRYLTGKVDGIRLALQAPGLLREQIEGLREQAEENLIDINETVDSATGGY